MPRNRTDYPDDLFDNTRMSFGDHIEELRSRLLKAIYGLLFFLIIGFVLDSIGDYYNMPNLGIGRPMMGVITAPVEDQVRNFYARRNVKSIDKLKDITPTDEEEGNRIRQKLKENGNDISSLSADEKKKLLGVRMEMPIYVKTDEFETLLKSYGIQATTRPEQDEVQIKAKVYPAYFNALNNDGEGILGTRRYLTTLSATEAFMVYFKVSLLCGFILGSPWIFYQMWAFIGAGLYPHERKYVHMYLPFSIGLFLSGVALCQFIVLPGAVKALLGFNSYVDLDPDLRLNEWLGFAIMLPLVFGISFQTPLVMFFMSRIGLFTAQTYLKRWRGALFTLAIFSAIITPTPDVVTMLYLFVPMFGLYAFGIAICHFFPATILDDVAEEQIAV